MKQREECNPQPNHPTSFPVEQLEPNSRSTKAGTYSSGSQLAWFSFPYSKIENRYPTKAPRRLQPSTSSNRLSHQHSRKLVNICWNVYCTKEKRIQNGNQPPTQPIRTSMSSSITLMPKGTQNDRVVKPTMACPTTWLKAKASRC